MGLYLKRATHNSITDIGSLIAFTTTFNKKETKIILGKVVVQAIPDHGEPRLPN